MEKAQTSSKVVVKSLSFGIVVGIVDAILVANLDPAWNALTLITVVTFWTILSLVISTSNFGGQPGIIKGVVWSIILNIPWTAHFASIGMANILPLFILVAFIYGAGIGWLNRRYNSI